MRFLIIFLLFFQFSNSSANKINFTSGTDIFGARVFVENKGQFDNVLRSNEKVRFGIDNGEEQIYFTNSGLNYVITKIYPLSEWQREEIEKGKKPKIRPTEVYFVKMNWLNANPDIQIQESEMQTYFHTYGKPEYQANSYKKITYKNVYNNIDIEYTIPIDKKEGIKYNVILHPGANPDDIKISYTGDVKKIGLNNSGEIQIKTLLGPITEHAPVSFGDTNEKIKTNFVLQNNIISFNFPEGYNASKTIVIDPWVTSITSLSSNNYGYDVDYDFAGNLYVYGGITTYKIAKYNPAGVLIWTFSGVIAVPAWTSSGNYFYPLIGNFIVDKPTQKCYTGQGEDSFGTRIVRLDVNGVYDNYITTQVTAWQECWDFGFKCTGEILGFGGTNNANNSGSIINQITGTISPNTFNPGFGTPGQDVANNAIDDNGDVFVIFSSVQTVFLNNKIAKLNPAFNNNVWIQPSQYTTLVENDNKASYIGSGLPVGSSNGFNCLAVNNSFLYYYDGFNLAAYNKITGVRVGFTTIAGHTPRSIGGIAVDDCNNVYVGGNNLIRSYNFTGTAFNALPNITLNPASPNKYIYDLKLDKNSNLLYASGSGFVGVYSAINSLTCTANQFSVTSTCIGNNNGQAAATVTTNLPGPLLSYTWSNLSGTVSVTSNTTALSNSVNLPNGTYTIAIQINAPCGPVWINTLNINCVQACSVAVSASTGCDPGGGTTSLSVLSVTGYTPAPTFTWSGPGAFTSNLQNVNFSNNNNYGTYTVVVSNGVCSYSTTVNTVALSQFTPAISNTAVTCFGLSTGLANATVAGGTAPFTYTWTSSPVQNNSNASNLAIGIYTCYVTDALGCTYSSTTQITQPPVLQLGITAANITGCVSSSIPLNGIATGGVAPYSYTWTAGPNTAAYSPSETLPGIYIYSLTVNDAKGCSALATQSITFSDLALPITVNSTVVCAGKIATLTAGGADNYMWMPGGITGNTYTVLASGNLNITVTGSVQGCSGSTNTSVFVNPLPLVNISAPVKEGCSPLCIEMQAVTANSIILYSWMINGVNLSVSNSILKYCFTVGGKYSVNLIATDNNGCKNVQSPVTINVFPKPTAEFTFKGNLTTEEPEVIFTDLSQSNIISWAWYFNDGLTANIKNPVHVYEKSSVYNIVLIVENTYGCSDTTNRLVKIEEVPSLFIPNSFTPNSDGLNDTFHAKGLGIKDFKMLIFDRWGEKIFEADNIFKGWDGMIKGTLAKQDTYVWKIEYSTIKFNSKTISGIVTLIR